MEPPSSSPISIVNKSGKRAPTALLVRALETAMSAHGSSSAVCVLLTDDEEMRDLNRRFRGIDESTDVLSFPSGDFSHGSLGDIAISVPYAERQARARGVSLSQELGFLAIHGGLHLLGFEDETEAQRAEMVENMNAVALRAGLKPDHEWASLLHEAVR